MGTELDKLLEQATKNGADFAAALIKSGQCIPEQIFGMSYTQILNQSKKYLKKNDNSTEKSYISSN